MTKTEIAKLAIMSLTDSGRLHLDVVEICRTLNLGTDGAVELRSMIVKEWLASDHDSDRRNVLGCAKTVINQYARDYSLR